MKYAKEVIGLMGAFPGQDFKMRHLVHHVNLGAKQSRAVYEATRRGVRRVLEQLIATGQVQKISGVTNGTMYAWKKYRTRT